MHIGTVAKLTGASPKAVRHYEQLGLLPPVKRRGTYRIYTNDDVQLIKWIKQAQTLGFKLSELGDLRDTLGTPDWAAIVRLVEAKRARIAAEVARLAAIDAQLAALAAELQDCDEVQASISACA
ncbi:MAG TPA: MerR family transcriptional regulator [Paucimonas sp.]|nr:MerR family transcriptional regulator [Paucimonas sp.]